MTEFPRPIRLRAMAAGLVVLLHIAAYMIIFSESPVHRAQQTDSLTVSSADATTMTMVEFFDSKTPDEINSPLLVPEQSSTQISSAKSTPAARASAQSAVVSGSPAQQTPNATKFDFALGKRVPEATLVKRRTPTMQLRPKRQPARAQTDIGRAISRNARRPCSQGYGALGLLALPFLVRDTLSDSGCKWD